MFIIIYIGLWEVLMKKSTKFLLFSLGVSAVSIYTYNKFIEASASSKNLLSDKDGYYYPWTHGNIFYTKTGTGSPILLVHDTDSSSSSAEWTKLIRRLEKKYTVYAIDLLGCGRSDKPALEYTTYLYVQMLYSFIENIIKEKTVVITSNLSTSAVVMANHMYPNLFKNIILINPTSIKDLNTTPDDISKLKKRMIELPFVGTFIYNIMYSADQIDYSFRTRFYHKPQLISSSMENVYYESAHKNGSNGRFLYSSLIGKYVNQNITHALKKSKTPILIIGSKEMKRYMLTLDDYHKTNKDIEIVKVSNSSLYPHMEIPDKVNTIIENFIFEQN